MKVKMCAIALWLAAALAGHGAEGPAGGTVLRHSYGKGEKYRVVSEVNEEVLINGAHSHRTDILNKVAVDTPEVRSDAGRLACEFQMSEVLKGKYGSFVLREDYRSDFWRDGRGAVEISPEHFMPVIRNLPLFPEGAVGPGSDWTGDAREVHDLRRGYGIQRPFSFPVRVHYKYLRDDVVDGRRMAVISIDYTVFHRVEAAGGARGPVPVRITGASEQTWLWDVEAGKMSSSREAFDYIFHLSNGSYVEYRGTATARLLRSEKMDRDRLADELGARVKKDGIGDTTVRKDDRGVTIVMENVRFPPNSADLTDAEKAKLDRIADILRRFGDRDLLVSGHTARVGDEKTSQTLSEERAAAVADYLISKGGCRKAQVVTRGRGSLEPAGDNATEEGRRKNRRVEITILEN